MRIDRLLMCKPTYFDIEYSINPWMDTTNRVDKGKAENQWAELYETLIGLKVEIELIDPVPGLPDMTFSGDCGLVHGKKFISSNFRHPERQGESKHYREWLRERGYEILNLPEGMIFEGLGDIVYYGNDVIFGYGPRSDHEAIDEVRKLLPDLNLMGELQIDDDAFFHVALAIAFIDKDTLVYYPDAFDDASRKFIEERFERALPVSEHDAKEYFVCNNIPVENKILMDNCSEDLEVRLNEWGYEVVKCDMGEFKKSGGSLRCLVLKL